jgi:RND family efflux transporter MFP subunit
MSRILSQNPALPVPARRAGTARNLGPALALALALIIPAATQAAEVWATGITEPINDVTMSSPVIGIIGARPFEEGARVTRGQVVVELDKRIEELDVNRKKFAQDLARTELDRVKSLSQKSAISISQEELDKKQAEYNIASVDHDLANEQLRRRLLIAPFDGYVAEIYLKVGEGCDVQQPVVRLVDTSRCYFVSNVEAQAGHDLKVAQKIKLEIEAGSTKVSFEGTISFVSPVVDPSSGLMKVKVVFENPDARIRPGVSGRMLLKES